jgi:hypothetical protein
MICYTRLSIPTNAFNMQQEVSELSEQCPPHLNLLQHDGKWTELSLRSPGGKMDITSDVFEEPVYADTLLMHECPAIKALVASLKCPVKSVKLLSLPVSAVSNSHHDNELAFERGGARLYFPIFTNPDVEFFVEDDMLPMKEGECWYINAGLAHHEANKGSTDRIHLVVDCVANEWLTGIFTDSERFCKIDYNLKEQLSIINELRKQNTESSAEIANSLEHSLWLIS